MEIIFKIISDYIIYLIPLLSVLYAFSIVNLPLTNYIFKNLSDRGFQTSKILGLVISSYIYFTIVSLDSLIKAGIFRLNSFSAILISILIMLLFNYLTLKHKFNTKIKEYYIEQLTSIKVLLKDEKIFFLLLIFFYFLNSFEKSIISSSEQPLHYMIIEKLRNSDSLPINDPEFAGEFLNYYYFGHFICFTLITFLPYSFNLTYLCLLIIIPTFIGILLIQLISDINNSYFSDREFKFEKKCALIFSFVIFFLFTTFTFTRSLIIGMFNNELPFSADIIWAELTRPIRYAITENFSFTVTTMTLHSHFVSLIFCLFCIRVLLEIHSRKIEFSIISKHFIFFGFFLGLMIMTNAADMIIYSGLLSIFIFFNQYKYFMFKKWEFIKKFILFLFIPLCTILLWKINIFTPGGMVEFVRNGSTISGFMSFWGSYIFIILLCFITIYKKFELEKLKIPMILLFFSIFLLIFIEIFYLKDISWSSEYHRANTYYKFSNQILLFLTISISIFLVPFFKYSSKFFKTIFLITCFFYSSYIPYIIFFNLANKSFTGIASVIDNSDFFRNNPDERALYEFILDKSFKDKVFLDYNEHGYTDAHYTLMLSARTSFLGYHAHQLSWRGNQFLVYDRIDIVNDIYLGNDINKSKKLLFENRIDYILINKATIEKISKNITYNYNDHKLLYPYTLQKDKLLKLGKVVFNQGNVTLIEVNK